MSLPLEQYGMIGDCQTAALVGADGSIDWLCFPRFDSAACFAALLGGPDNGRWLLAPCDAPQSIRRRYRDDTLILETDYETADGAVTVIDCMPPRGQEPDLVRIVDGRRGNVRMKMELIIRFDYGSVVPWVRRVEQRHHRRGRPRHAHLANADRTARRESHHRRGFHGAPPASRRPFVLTWYASHVPTPGPVDAQQAISLTDRAWWRDWSSRCTYDGPWRDAVMRSLITLKALTYAPTGGIVAAPTTSLPEQLGGVRNWDYRFCWLRDATFTLYALLMHGLLRRSRAPGATGCSAPSPATPPAAADHVRHHRRAPADRAGAAVARRATKARDPVRIGNAASEQFQLDVYGEVLDTLHLCAAARLARARSRTGGFRRRCCDFWKRSLARARRRNLGSARAAAAFHPFQSDGLGRV